MSGLDGWMTGWGPRSRPSGEEDLRGACLNCDQGQSLCHREGGGHTAVLCSHLVIPASPGFREGRAASGKSYLMLLHHTVLSAFLTS